MQKHSDQLPCTCKHLVVDWLIQSDIFGLHIFEGAETTQTIVHFVGALRGGNFQRQGFGSRLLFAPTLFSVLFRCLSPNLYLDDKYDKYGKNGSIASFHISRWSKHVETLLDSVGPSILSETYRFTISGADNSFQLEGGMTRCRPGILGTFIGYWVVGLPLAALLGCVWHWPTPLLGVWFGHLGGRRTCKADCCHVQF